MNRQVRKLAKIGMFIWIVACFVAVSASGQDGGALDLDALEAMLANDPPAAAEPAPPEPAEPPPAAAADTGGDAFDFPATAPAGGEAAGLTADEAMLLEEVEFGDDAAAGDAAADAGADAADPGAVPAGDAVAPELTDDGEAGAVGAAQAAAAAAAVADADADADADAAAAPVADALQPQPEEMEANERVRRQELQLLAEVRASQALAAHRRGEFTEAEAKYREAIANLRRVSRSDPATLRKIDQYEDALFNLFSDWADAIAIEARDAAQTERFDLAVARCQDAAQLDPSRRAEMDQRIKKYQRMQQEARFVEDTKESNVDIDKLERDDRINVLFAKGKVYFDNQRYADARDLFEQILVDDPYEQRSIRYLGLIQQRLYEIARQKRKTTTQERMSEVRWKWNEPVSPILVNPSRNAGGEAIRKQNATGIRAKLEQIILPKVTFEEVTIPQVVQFLKLQSQMHDTSDGEGINIILQMSGAESAAAVVPGAAPAPAGGDDFGGFGDFDAGADFGAPPADGGGGGGMAAPANSAATRTITMNMDNIPLGEVIRYVCLGSGLKYKVEDFAVVIADQSVAFDTLETRDYPVEAGVLDQQRTRQRGERIGGDDDDDDDGGWGNDNAANNNNNDGGGAGGGIGTTSEDLKSFFQNFGVDFPDGTRISYHQRSASLIVHNTRENLQKIEKVLEKINVTPTQVTIEAKFVEVKQTDLENLGFDWTLATPSSLVRDPLTGQAVRGDGLGVGKGSHFMQILEQNPGAGNAQLSGGLRTIGTALGGVGDVADRILEIYSVLGTAEFRTIIHAIRQQTNSDLLSAPKVTTLSGNTAIIRMTIDRQYPASWSEPEFNVAGDDGGGGMTFRPSVPDSYDSRETGVILEVTPTVAADDYSIDLELRPEVIQFLGYDTENNTKAVVAGSEIEIKAQTPIFSTRSVETKVIVWDGETVVLGGWIDEQLESYHDKVPFLGSLPLIGRMFQSSGERSVKTNLLIFVSARLVNPAGLPKRPNEVRGLFDYRR